MRRSLLDSVGGLCCVAPLLFRMRCFTCSAPGAAQKCSGCHSALVVVAYCDVACQRKDWSDGHKKECKALAAVGAQAATTANGALPPPRVPLALLGSGAPSMCGSCGAADANELCGGCQSVVYCNAACRREARHRVVGGHKLECKAIAESTYVHRLVGAYKDSAASQYNLGILYASGAGVTADDRMAVRWCKRAAEAGYMNAQFNLGVCYEKGTGVSADAVEAVRWYKRAAEAGHTKAQLLLGKCFLSAASASRDTSSS